MIHQKQLSCLMICPLFLCLTFKTFADTAGKPTAQNDLTYQYSKVDRLQSFVGYNSKEKKIYFRRTLNLYETRTTDDVSDSKTLSFLIEFTLRVDPTGQSGETPLTLFDQKNYCESPCDQKLVSVLESKLPPETFDPKSIQGWQVAPKGLQDSVAKLPKGKAGAFSPNGQCQAEFRNWLDETEQISDWNYKVSQALFVTPTAKALKSLSKKTNDKELLSLPRVRKLYSRSSCLGTQPEFWWIPELKVLAYQVPIYQVYSGMGCMPSDQEIGMTSFDHFSDVNLKDSALNCL
jgi:hypothetical protein